LVNKLNVYGATPLHISCKNGNLEMIKTLVKRGGDLEILSKSCKDKFENLLEVSTRWNHKKIVYFLLEQHKWDKNYINKAIKCC